MIHPGQDASDRLKRKIGVDLVQRNVAINYAVAAVAHGADPEDALCRLVVFFVAQNEALTDTLVAAASKSPVGLVLNMPSKSDHPPQDGMRSGDL